MPGCSEGLILKHKGKAINAEMGPCDFTRRVVPFLVWRIAPAKLLRGRQGTTLQTKSILYLSNAVVPTLNLQPSIFG